MKNVMLMILAVLTTTPSFASGSCEVLAMQAGQAVAQSNGLTGNQVVAPYSGSDQILVTVEGAQTYAVNWEKNLGTCRILKVAAQPYAHASKPVSNADCNINAQRLAQKIAQLNGLSGNTVQSAYSFDGRFLVTVDNMDIYTVTASQDRQCIFENISLN